MPVPPFQSHSMPTTCPWSALSFLASRHALTPFDATRRPPLRERQRYCRPGLVEYLYPYHPPHDRAPRPAQRGNSRTFSSQFRTPLWTPSHRQSSPLSLCRALVCVAVSAHARMLLTTSDRMLIDGRITAELGCSQSVAMKCKCNLQTAHSALNVARVPCTFTHLHRCTHAAGRASQLQPRGLPCDRYTSEQR